MNKKKVSFIDISKYKQNGDEILVEEIAFWLTPKLVRQIHLAKSQKSKLKLSLDLSTQINNYLRDNLDYLVFKTYYNQKPWVKTAITLEGNYQCYFPQDSLNEENLTLDIVAVHHWLMGEILGQLKAPVASDKNRYDWLYGVLALVLVGIVVGLNWQIFTPFNPIYIVLIIVCFLLLTWIIKNISLFLRR